MSSDVVAGAASEANEKEAQFLRLEELNQLMAVIYGRIDPRTSRRTSVEMSPSELYRVCEVSWMVVWGKNAFQALNS